MRFRRRTFVALALVFLALGLVPAGMASPDAGVAALQVALHARGLYSGTIDRLW